MAHDRFGWMLAFGDCAWLPFTYTLQGWFLLHHPVDLAWPYAAAVLACGLAGFFLFVSANEQRAAFRRHDATTRI
jgi:hypothetical protein